jgi:hypothetical protein
MLSWPHLRPGPGTRKSAEQDLKREDVTPNGNQGAESTLAFLLSLAEMNLVEESSLAAFHKVR